MQTDETLEGINGQHKVLEECRLLKKVSNFKN